MRFLVDNQLPKHLADWLGRRGHDCEHVLDVDLDESSDLQVWQYCGERGAVLVTKDEDFVYLAHRGGDRGRMIWVRLGNCRNAALIAALNGALDQMIDALEQGQRIVEIR